MARTNRRALIQQLDAKLADWGNTETTVPGENSEPSPILPGDPVHRAGDVLRQDFGGTLPGEAESLWLKLLYQSRHGKPADAWLTSLELRQWCQRELRPKNGRNRRASTGIRPLTARQLEAVERVAQTVKATLRRLLGNSACRMPPLNSTWKPAKRNWAPKQWFTKTKPCPATAADKLTSPNQTTAVAISSWYIPW